MFPAHRAALHPAADSGPRGAVGSARKPRTQWPCVPGLPAHPRRTLRRRRLQCSPGRSRRCAASRGARRAGREGGARPTAADAGRRSGGLRDTGRVPEPQCRGARVVDQGGAGAGRLPWEFRSIRDAHFGGTVPDLLSWSSRASAHPSTLTLVSKSSGFGFLTWILMHNILSLPASSPSHTSQSRFTFPSSLPRHLRWIAPPLLLSFKLTPPTALHRESA